MTYAWTQTSGTTVTLNDATAQSPTFTAPSHRTDLEFSLVVHVRDQPERGGHGGGGGAHFDEPGQRPLPASGTGRGDMGGQRRSLSQSHGDHRQFHLV